MITIAVCILFLAFYTLYYTSKRVRLSYNIGFEKWMQKNPSFTKTIGITLLATAYVLWISATAFGVGSLSFVIALMTIGSLIVILKPLKIIPVQTIIALFAIIGIIEIYYS